MTLYVSYDSDLSGRTTGYSLTVAVPSLDINSMDGSTGAISFSSANLADPGSWIHATLQLYNNPQHGDNSAYLYGQAMNITWSSFGDSIQFDGDTYLGAAVNNPQRFVPGINQQGAGRAAQNVLQTVGVFSNTPDATAPAALPGYYGDVWDYLKLLCAQFDLEITPASLDISDWATVRPVRSSTLDIPVTGYSRSLSKPEIGPILDVVYYNYRNVKAGELWPQNIETGDQTVISVGPGEYVEQDVELSAWVSSVSDPVPTDSYLPGQQSGPGRYFVSTDGGSPVSADAWTAHGGWVKIKTTDTPNVVKVCVQGCSLPPGFTDVKSFSLGVYSVSSEGDDGGGWFNTLHINGKGMAYDKRTVRVCTGGYDHGADGVATNPKSYDGATSTTESVTTLDSPFTNTLDDAYRMALRASAAYSRGAYTMSAGAAPREDYATVPGARWRDKDAFFRITSATFTQDATTFDAEMDTLASDFNDTYSGMTAAQFNAARPQLTASQFNVAPLRKET